MISVVLVVLLPLITAIPVLPDQKKCTQSCLSSYTNEVPNAPLIYDYQNQTEIDQSQLCNYVRKMVFCYALCPNEVTDEDKPSVARNFALSYLCKKHEDSLPEILNVIGQLPINAYNECSETCQKIQDSCEKQTCYKNCLKENYSVCEKETPCMNLITAEVFIHNFPFESNSKNSDELKQQTDSHMEHIPEPSKCLTNLISDTANIEGQQSNDEIEASGIVESIEPNMEEGSDGSVATGEPDLVLNIDNQPVDYENQKEFDEQIVDQLGRDLEDASNKKNDEVTKMETIDGSTESVSSDEPEMTSNVGETSTMSLPTEAVGIVADESSTVVPSLQVDATETSVISETSGFLSTETAISTDAAVDNVETTEKLEISEETTTGATIETSPETSLESGSGMEPELGSTPSEIDEIEVESIEEANRINSIQADSAIANSETSLEGQKEVVPTEITAERTEESETTETPEDVEETTELTMTSEGQESSMPTIIVDDKSGMLDSNRVESGETTTNGAFGLFGSLASVFITLMLLQ
ncbi:unnamed protein product [Auanema sp. JU1783]|nr:unnamed protein product [Auanema sp. JU1783]